MQGPTAAVPRRWAPAPPSRRSSPGSRDVRSPAVRNPAVKRSSGASGMPRAIDPQGCPRSFRPAQTLWGFVSWKAVPAGTSSTPTIDPTCPNTPTNDHKLANIPTIDPKYPSTPTINPKCAIIPTIDPKCAITPTIDPKCPNSHTIDPRRAITSTINPTCHNIPTINPKLPNTLTPNNTITAKMLTLTPLILSPCPLPASPCPPLSPGAHQSQTAKAKLHHTQLCTALLHIDSSTPPCSSAPGHPSSSPRL
ncbi:hypothetical protein AAY473_040509 [Plecturocebus cupreus]